MPLTAAQLAILRRYQTQEANLRAQVLGSVGALWAGLQSWRDADVEAFAQSAARVVTGGQAATASITAAYLANLEQAAGRPPRPFAVPTQSINDEALRGIAAVDVYRRAGPTVWTALSAGKELPEAVRLGAMRVADMAATDLQLAKTHTARRFVKERGYVGYRRVLRGSESCALCIVASTQRYHVDELMPIHPGCDCGVAPIIGDRDPGQVIDPDRLEGVHDRIAERFGAADAGARLIRRDSVTQYRDVLVTHEHGEIGPILAVRGQKFTGPEDI